MKIIRKTLLISLFLTTSSAYAINFDSSYTSINESDCKTLTSDEIESTQACQSFADIDVNVIEADLRQSLTLVRNGKRFPLNFWNTVSPYFSVLGKKIEWRHKKGKPTEIIGMITRLNVSENTENPEKNTVYLVVSKITNNEMCVVGKVYPQAKQNEKARTLVEKAAAMPCLTSTEENNLNTPTHST